MKIRFIKLERDKKNCHYYAEIEVNGTRRSCQIFTSHFISWAPGLEGYNILDRTSYKQVNRSSLSLRVVSLDGGGRSLASEVEEAIREYVLEEEEEEEEPAEVL